MAEQEKGEASEALSELFQDIEKRTGLTHIPGAGFWSAEEIEVLKDVGHGVLRHTPSVWEQVRESAWADVSKITRKQERLTTEQKDYARQFAQERIASMLSCTAIDESQAEAHLHKAYEVAGLPAPKRIRWFDSPISFVWASVRAIVIAYYDENWLSFYRFFHEIFKENDLIHLALLNEMISGYRLGREEAWLVRKPIRLERDEQGRLHSENGMCMAYRDGWGFYAWHGVRCPKRLILHPEQLSKEDWLNEDNLEVRRTIQERLGNDRFVELVGGTCIDRGQRGKLIAVDLGDDPEKVAHFVHVKDTSTERQYYLRVPPGIRRADEAVAWTFGLDEATYQPLQEA